MAVHEEYQFMMLPLAARNPEQNLHYVYLLAPCKCIRLNRRKGHFDYLSEKEISGASVEFHLSIRAVNHQIYEEASSVFFSSLTLLVEIPDIKNLRMTEYENPEDMMYFTNLDHLSLKREVYPPNVSPSCFIWRYNPMNYVPSPIHSGKPGHDPYSDEDIFQNDDRWDGKMEPHFFVQFRNILVHIASVHLMPYFGHEFLNHEIWRQPKPTLKEFVGASRLFGVLSRLLSGVKALKTLEISLDIEGHLERLPSDQHIQSNGNGFLYSLSSLANVQRFEIKVRSHDESSKRSYRKLGRISSKVVEKLKNEIAANIAGTPFLSDSGITWQLVEERGRGLQCSRMQLQAIEDKNLTPRATQALLDMIELQKAHQEKIDKIQREINRELRR
ncbi:hypothetical protein HYFRA_00004044 [Hymenoscyphus fraxineus]|uniref:Uncharacterized protein n=1 Tax=Hymenoscyphus fraxineus TaxID=746836 RepID=A0A9N9KMJ8_9HELO|nr:hypothetical protein HYFRA_00004044 [Hymenoscyphus fraxineus]